MSGSRCDRRLAKSSTGTAISRSTRVLGGSMMERGQHRRPPVQVGSHVHLPQANAALQFDRAAAHGHRLDIPAGTAVRFEPGVAQRVSLVPLSGSREVHGLQPATARDRLDAAMTGTVPRRRVRGAVRSDHRRPDPAGRHRPVRGDHRGPQRRARTGRRRGRVRRRQGVARVDGARPRNPRRRRARHRDHRRR